MDCRTFHRKLEDYLEGGLDFPAQFGMERHAKQCFACEREVSEALRLRHMARELRRVTAPVDFEASLLARIRADKSPRRFWQRQGWWLYGFESFSWKAASATALITVLVVGAVTYIHLRPGLNRQAQSQAIMERPAAVPATTGNGNGTVRNDGQVRSDVRSPSAAMPRRAAGPAPEMAQSASRDQWAKPFADPADSDFMEFLVPVSGDRQLIMRLPMTIRMRYDQPSREYFIRNVSH